MPKIIDTVEVQPKLLKELALKMYETLSSFADDLDVSKQALNFWLTQSRIPTAKLPKVISLLKVDADQVKELFPPKEHYQVLFRTRRNIPVMKAKKIDAGNIGQEFFSFHESNHSTPPRKVKLIKDTDPKKFAESLRHQLGIKEDTPLTTSGLIKLLERFNIHVLFVDFDLAFNFHDIKESNIPTAFCLKEENSDKYSIVVNMREHTDDILWILLHELAHIFSGHLENHSEDIVEDKAQEVFCNNVASEILTPSSWFSVRREILSSKLKSGALALYYADEIARKLNSSFMGTILALDSNKIISSHTKAYLMKVYHARKNDRQKMYEFISSEYETNKEAYWKNAFKSFEACNYLKMQNLVRKGLIENSISLDRASEILGVDSLGVSRLKKTWENENEISTNL